MSTTLIVIGLIIVVVVAGVLIVAATKPDTFRLERSASINAPPARVYALIDDFKQWRSWSPWEKLDPDLKRTYSGAASGLGAVYAWEGNNKVGQGRMEIIESVPPSRVVIKLDFIKPFKANNTAIFTLEPRGEATHVNWAMQGPNLFVSKLMSVFMNFEKMVGRQFEEGLANMKAAAESNRPAIAEK